MSLITRKPVFGVCDQVRLKPACSAIEARYRLEITDIETRGILLSRQQTTKMLIRLHRCSGLSASLLFGLVFWWRGSYHFVFQGLGSCLLTVGYVLEFQTEVFTGYLAPILKAIPAGGGTGADIWTLYNYATISFIVVGSVMVLIGMLFFHIVMFECSFFSSAKWICS